MRARLRQYFSRTAMRRRHYDRACSGILKTPPLEIRDAPLRFLSMMCHRDVIPYLVAIKSVYSAVGEGRIILVDDGTLEPGDKALFEHHLGNPEIIHLDDVDTGPCPRGGTWERLVRIIDLLGENYVIQVDADTVATGPLDQVVQCYRDNRSFTLGTPTGRDFSTLTESAVLAADLRRGHPKQDHMQFQVECAFDKLPDAGQRRYVRGSSGFAGFARGAVSRADIEEFSNHVEAQVGREVWSRWGSEQITSNYLIANAPDSMVLPQPGYVCYRGGAPDPDTVFLHFVGERRYDDGVYTRVSRAAIAALMAR